MDDNKIKVLYISGWGRSGSTILARILGQIDGFFHGGELRTIWVDGLKPNGTCGCGVLVRDCPVWNAVCDRAFDGMDKIDPKAITRLQRSTEPRTQEVLLNKFLPNSQSKLKSRLEDYRVILDKLYRAIHEVTGSRVIVDDSNHPGYAYTLSMMSNIDLYIIHLIRDPRATAYSWSQRQKKGLGTYSIRDNALGWTMRNIVTESLAGTVSGKYLRIFYEDFAAQPKSTIERILHKIDEQPSQLPFISENEVKLGISHSVFGNPNRTDSGAIKIKLDDEWKQKIDKTARRKVTTLTFPLLLKYGYLNR
jgi:Sulfotransferase family